MLFKRYANPMILVDSMIKAHRFNEFVCEFIDITNEELEDHTLWEFWLHKVFDQGYKDFYDQSKTKRVEKIPPKSTLEATVKESAEMLNGFHLS